MTKIVAAAASTPPIGAVSFAFALRLFRRVIFES